MEKKLKDYIHFYIGQQAEVFWSSQGRVESEGIGIVIGVKTPVDLTQEHPITVRKKIGAHSTDMAEYNYAYEDVKLLLRPLSDVSDEEALQAADILGGASHISEEGRIRQFKELMERVYNMQTNIPGMRWMRLTVFLLSRGFDLFDLIESGVAIDKTKGKEGMV